MQLTIYIEYFYSGFKPILPNNLAIGIINCQIYFK